MPDTATSSTSAQVPDGTLIQLTTAAVDGALRVLMLLSRSYSVQSFGLRSNDSESVWTVDCALALAERDVALLLARLHRIPSVLTADRVTVPIGA